MNRPAILLAALALAIAHPTAVGAQEQLNLGLAGGPTYTKLSGEYIGDTEWTWGWTAGLFVQERRNSWFANLEVNLVRKGGLGTTLDGDAIDLELGYLEIPFVAGPEIPLSPQLSLAAYGGIAFAFRTGCRIGVDGASKTSCGEATPGGDAKSSEWTVPLGGALAFQVGSATATLDGRYMLGLSRVFADRDLKNRGWSLRLRVGFPIKTS